MVDRDRIREQRRIPDFGAEHPVDITTALIEKYQLRSLGEALERKRKLLSEQKPEQYSP